MKQRSVCDPEVWIRHLFWNANEGELHEIDKEDYFKSLIFKCSIKTVESVV